MTVSVTRLAGPVQLTTSAVTYYTVPSATSAQVRRATFDNTSGAAVTITVYVVPAAGTASAANTLVSAQSIAAGASYQSPELAGLSLIPGDTIQALASAGTSITMVISGVTIV